MGAAEDLRIDAVVQEGGIPAGKSKVGGLGRHGQGSIAALGRPRGT